MLEQYSGVILISIYFWAVFASIGIIFGLIMLARYIKQQYKNLVARNQRTWKQNGNYHMRNGYKNKY